MAYVPELRSRRWDGRQWGRRPETAIATFGGQVRPASVRLRCRVCGGLAELANRSMLFGCGFTTHEHKKWYGKLLISRQCSNYLMSDNVFLLGTLQNTVKNACTKCWCLG